jgi:hypothetical protein
MHGGGDGDGDDGGVAVGAGSQETRRMFRICTSDSAVRHISQEVGELWCFHRSLFCVFLCCCGVLFCFIAIVLVLL